MNTDENAAVNDDTKTFEESLNKEKQDIENEVNKIETARLIVETVDMDTDIVIENPNVLPIPKSDIEGHKTPPVPSIGYSSLGLIASYGSSSDEEEDISTDNEAPKIAPVKMDQANDYRINNNDDDDDDSSSDEDSDSSSDDSSSSSSSDSSDDLEAIELEFDSANKKKSGDGALKVRGEKTVEDLPPIEDLHISVPEAECIKIGKVQSIVAQLLLVETLPGTAPLDLDTVLFLDQGARPLGRIFDVIGQITAPMYCIRFNSRHHIEELGIEIGMDVYCAPRSEHTSFVILSNIMNMKGSDASWENDIEADPSRQDYSDDEEERAARRAARNARSSANNTTNENSSATNTQQQQQPKPRRQPRQRSYEPNANFNNYNNYHVNDHAMNQPLQFSNPFHPQYNTNNMNTNNMHNNMSWHHNLPPMANMPGPSYPNPYSQPFNQRYRMSNYRQPHNGGHFVPRGPFPPN